MTRSGKTLVLAVAVAAITAFSAAAWLGRQVLPVASGYVAKYLCSAVFVSGREPAAVFEEDIRPVNPLARMVRWSVDRTDRSVTARALGLSPSRAIYRDGMGCTLVRGVPERELRTQASSPEERPYVKQRGLPDIPWPEGEGMVDPGTTGIDGELLGRALDEAFAEPVPGESNRRTRAVVIVYNGRLVAERYAPGFSVETPLLGWSMAKSVTNAVAGILVRKGLLELSAPAPVPEWQSGEDPRRTITLDQLMRMSSGLHFDETYLPLRDAVNMLYRESDFAAYAARKPLEAEPDRLWNYSSGTANIIAGVIRRVIEERGDCPHRFIHRELFEKIGMASAVMEWDPSGTFVGSSYAFATPRDWARFGQLYLQDGVWDGERILPEEWVSYTATPTEPAPRGEYGALFWLNAGGRNGGGDRLWADAPRDAFAAQGFQEQRVIIIPSKQLALVRFGATSDRDAWDTNAFILSVLRALPSSCNGGDVQPDAAAGTHRF